MQPLKPAVADVVDIVTPAFQESIKQVEVCEDCRERLPIAVAVVVAHRHAIHRHLARFRAIQAIHRPHE